MSRSSTIKSESKFIKIIVQMIMTNSTLMCSHKPAFQQRSNPVAGRQQVVFGRQVSHSRMPQKKPKRSSLCGKENVRNVNCKHYLTCLHTAALANARDLGCENCSFRMDNTYKMTIRDFTGLMGLYYEVMDPEVSEVIEIF